MKKILIFLLFLPYFLHSQVFVPGQGNVSTYNITNDPDNVTIEENISNKLEVKDASLDTSKLVADIKNQLLTISKQYYVDLQTDFNTAIRTGSVTTVSPDDTVTIADTSQPLVSNSILIGSGKSSVITTSKSATVSLSALTIDSDSNIVISGIHFSPQKNTSYNSEQDHAIMITDSSKNIWIIDCTFDCVGDGIYIGGTTAIPENIRIINCTFIGDSLETSYNPPTSRNGVSVVNGTNILISNNYMKGFHSVGCIDIEPNSNQTVDGVIIEGNHLRPHGRGIYVSGGATNRTVKNITIKDNYIDRTDYAETTAGIHTSCDVDGLLSNIVIEGNTIKGSVDAGFYANLYITGQGENFIINNNISYNSCTHGIQVSNGMEGVTVSNNTCYNNNQHGIYFYGSTSNKTSTLSNTNFELDDGSWLNEGTPTTLERNSDAAFQGTYSYKVITDAAFEGMYQILNTSASDTFSIFHAKAFVYLANDATHGTVGMSVGGDRYELQGRSAKESNFDSTWQVIETFFRPSGTDTLFITGSKSGMTFYVDSLLIYQRNNVQNTIITENQCYGNGFSGGSYYGIKLTQVIEGIITDNIVTGSPQPKYNSATQYRGLGLEGVFFSTIEGNIGWNNTNNDLYLGELLYSSLATKGMKTMYVDRGLDHTELSFPDAKCIMFTEDSLEANISTREIQFSGHTPRVRMPEAGRILGLSAFLTSPMDGGEMKIYPQIGNSVNSSITTRSYLYLTLSGNPSGVYSDNLDIANTSGYFDFQAGDFLTVAIYTNSQYSTLATSYLTVYLLYE